MNERLQIAALALQGLLASGHFTENSPEEGPWILLDPDHVESCRIPAINAALMLADRLIEAEEASR